MSIKKKQAGAAPEYPLRWQQLATDSKRLTEARSELMSISPELKLIEAHKQVKAFHDKHIKTYRRT